MMLNKVIQLVFLYLLPGASYLYSEDRFSLPANKTITVKCQDAVLAKHQGKITSEKMIHFPAGNIGIHFEINDKDSSDWLVICDGVTGKILKDIKLDEEK